MIVILGGGVCGLYAARILTLHGCPVTVIETEEVPGGLARGHRRGGNFYDLGVHMLHKHDKEIFRDIQVVMGEEGIEVPLDAKIRWGGSHYRYPLQFADIVRGVPPFRLAKMIIGLLTRQLREKISESEAHNAEDALIQLYGRPLYEFFFKDFTHRYWGIPASELSATFVRSKMPRLTAVDAIKKLLAMLGVKERAGASVESALLDETLYYSRSGAEALPRCIARDVQERGGKILTNSTVEQIVLDDNRVTSVCYRNAETNEPEWIDCNHCISTIPIPQMIDSLSPSPPETVVHASSELRYKPIAIYGLLVRKEKAIDGLYVYYRDRIFHRVGEPKNAGITVKPPGHTVLIVEMTCEMGDAKWKGDASIRERMIADLEAEGICGGDEIVETHLLRSANGYPIFSLGFEPHLNHVQDYLKAIPNLQSTGRQGGFCYPNMHSAMRMGADAAEQVVASRRKGVQEQRFSREHQPSRVTSS